MAGHGEDFYREACRRQLEGIVSKRADSQYGSERSRNWLKVKCSRRQEFVVGGYTESGAGRLFGSLLAGYHDGAGELVFAGKIKTGYSGAESRRLIEIMKRYEQPEPPFKNPPSGHEYRNPHWLRPDLVAEVEYAEVTGTGLLRHASFQGLREDKDAREVILEFPEPLQEPLTETLPLQDPEPPVAILSATSPGALPGAGSQSLPEPLPETPAEPPPEGASVSLRLRKAARKGSTAVFPHEKLGKDDILSYYSLVGDLMLPYLSNRPLTLIVCPTNIYACKFTKHATNLPPPVKAIDAGHEEKYLVVDSKEGVLALVGKGAVEFHGWQSRYTNLEFPDRLLFDLDPPETDGFSWERLGEAALLLRLHLQQYGLESYLQTSGGKGY